MICALVCVCVRGWPKEVSVKYANECITMTNEFCNGARWWNGGGTQLHSECFNWFSTLFSVFFFSTLLQQVNFELWENEENARISDQVGFQGIHSNSWKKGFVRLINSVLLSRVVTLVRLPWRWSSWDASNFSMQCATICCAFFFSQPTMAIYACGWMEWIHPHRRQWPIFNQFKFK